MPPLKGKGDKKPAAQVPSAIKDFLAELEDLLETLGRDLVGLEGLLADGKEDPDLINSLFRSVHTIKGVAGMLSLTDMGVLAHSLEDLLDGVRLGKVELTEDVYEVISRGYELLTAFAKAVTGGEQVSGLEDFLARVERAVTARSEALAPPPASAGTQVGLDEQITKTLTEYEEHRLKENIKNGKNLYILHKAFSFENFDGELNSLLAALKKEGEVISTLPSSSVDDPTKISFDLIWATPLDETGVGAAFSFAERELSVIQYQKPAPPAAVAASAPAAPPPDAAERDGVSSTLRSLSETVRVDIRRLDNLMNVVGELVIYKTHLGDIAREFLGREGMTPTALDLSKTVKALERALNFLQKGVIEARMVPVGQMFGKLHRVVRKLARDMGKEVELVVSGEDTELDKLVIEDMADPLLHLIRNAIDHGIEKPAAREKAGKSRRGTISLAATQKGHHVIIEVEDDGAGIDTEKVRAAAVKKGLLDKGQHHDQQQVLSVLFHPGFSTAEKVTEVSGRGVGMDVVKTSVGRLRGMIDIATELGEGTNVIITLPMTLAIIQALMVNIGDEIFAIPISSVLESVKVRTNQIGTVEKKEVIRLRDSILPLLRLDEYFKLSRGGRERGRGDTLYVVVVGLAEKRLGLVVDSLRGQQEIVVKSLGELLKPIRGIAGATELGDRRAVLVLDVGGLIQEVTHVV